MLDEDTIDNYQKLYESGGVYALLKDNYQGISLMLSDTEMLELTKHLEENAYLTVDSIVGFVKNIIK